MTTDSLKSFITLPTETIYGRRRAENTKFILLSSFVLIFSIGISSYVIWSSLRMGELRDEVHQLRDKLEDLRKRMGLDLLDDLHDFEVAHENPHHHPDAFLEDFDNSVDDFDDGDYGFDDLTMEEDEEDEDEDDTEDRKEGSGIFKMFPDDEEYDSIYDEIKKSRKPRAIPPHEGVPVVEESYAVRRNKTNTPADDMVVNVLLNRNASPKLKYDWGQKPWIGSERRPQNAVHRRPPRRYQSFNAAPTQFVDKDVTLTIRESDGKPHNALHIRHRNHHPNMQPNLQEHVAAATQFVNRRDMNIRNFAPGDSAERKKKNHHANKSRTIAIHYVGDENKYFLESAQHSRVNARLSHYGQVYKYWTPSTWASNMGMENFFSMQNGVVTVKEGGLYLIYAQIYYDDVRDRNSFTVKHNGNTFLHCEAMTYSERSVNKTNTCYTSGVALLKPDDQITVKDTEHHRFVLFHPHTSFFGLVKLGDVRVPGHVGGIHHQVSNDDIRGTRL
ncbi:uncharacterized protein LOC132264085 isoform X1 [Phlebotomus argentipes]|uniref:uncharacterized protein LOC132264085 isoform X1 n=1 Tax=Phlebotomus argentipes TaxID=94469 RepID=UPI002892E3A1|nr:uncharacterized protein LOC132264085 isoform X1 [Phlebotomus argentipes]